MVNSVMLVGRLKEFKEENLTLTVPKAYKNEKGKYENDNLIIHISGGLAKNVKSYCHRGDVVGIRGRICEGNIIEAEKISFLSSKSNK